MISTNVVPPYRLSLFAALAELLKTAGGGLTVVAWAPDMEGRSWRVDNGACGFDLLHAGTRVMRGDSRVTPAVLPNLSRILMRLPADALVTTGFGPASMVAAGIGRLRRVPTFLWSEAIGGSADYDDHPLRLRQRRWLAKATHGIVVPGSAAETYARQFHERLLTLRNTIDLNLFRAERTPQEPFVLTVGQLQGYRNHDLLVGPVKKAIANGYYRRWVLVGDGPELEALTARCQAALGAQFTHITHASPEKVAELLRSATCFASVPSRDIWGFAVQEAILTGVPVVISPNVGCAADLASPENGAYVTTRPPEPTSEFTEDVYRGLVAACAAETQEQSLLAASGERHHWSPFAAADAFVTELMRVIGRNA